VNSTSTSTSLSGPKSSRQNGAEQGRLADAAPPAERRERLLIEVDAVQVHGAILTRCSSAANRAGRVGYWAAGRKGTQRLGDWRVVAGTATYE